MITLTKYEKKWIKLFKLHYKEKYPWNETWIKTCIPLFIEIYGWNPNEDNNYRDYLNCLFNKLLEIHLKIVLDYSGNNSQLKSIFGAAFETSIFREDKLSIERAICQLISLIQNNIVIEDGIERYSLD